MIALLLPCAGTVAYMAPEVLQKGAMAMPADVYSFAMLMLELWTGEIVYSGINSHQVTLALALPARLRLQSRAAARGQATCGHHMKACCAKLLCPGQLQGAAPDKIWLYGSYWGLSLLCQATDPPAWRNLQAPPLLSHTGFLHPQVLFQVFSGQKPPVPDDMPPGYRALLGQCWATDPAARPKIQAVLPQLCTMLEELRTQQATLF